MKIGLSSLVLASALLMAPPACADIGGLWRVTGTLSGVAFALDCRLVLQGASLGGVCTGVKDGDAKYAGKTYKLTRGVVNGDQVSWSYPTSYMFFKFNVNYAGTIAGDHIAGSVEASGRKGVFSAVRE